MLEKNEKLILKQQYEAKNAFDNFIEETRALANLKMKQIFNKKTEPKSDAIPN